VTVNGEIVNSERGRDEASAYRLNRGQTTKRAVLSADLAALSGLSLNYLTPGEI
jgi:hypothetical protein